MNCEPPPFASPHSPGSMAVVDDQRLDCKHRGRCLTNAAAFDMPAMSCKAPDGSWCASHEARDKESMRADHAGIVTLLAASIEHRPCLGCRRLRPPWELACGECAYQHYKAKDGFKSPKALITADGTKWRRTR